MMKTMPDLPSIRAKDVSPESPYRLSASAVFVVAEKDGNGKRLVKSQHRSLGSAIGNRKRIARGRCLALADWPRVYRVVRETSDASG